MPVVIKVQEGGGSGTAESHRTYQIVGDQNYRHQAVPTLARLSQAVEHEMDWYRSQLAKDRLAVMRGDR